MTAEARHTDRSGLVLGVFAALALTSAVGIVYWRAIDAPFIFDDGDSVEHNHSITRLWPLSTPLSGPFGSPTAGRPLVNLSFALNYHWGALEPRGYRLVNMLLHALSAMLLYGIVRRTLRLPFFASRFDSAAELLALAVALLWTVHPLQTESVVYVTQRTELMVGFFYLTTLYASLRYWLAESKDARYAWMSLAILAALGGMASKEVMVSAPLVVLLFDRVFHSGSFRKAVQSSWPLYVGLAATWGLLLALNLHRPRAGAVGFHLEVTPVAWWLTQTKIFLLYLKLAFWPWPLAIHYEMPYMTTVADAWKWLLATILIALGSLALFWRGHAAGFIGAWVFAILSPTFIVPIMTEVAAERRMYLPLAGIVALVVVGVYCLGQLAWRSGNGRGVLLATLTSALGVAIIFAIVGDQRLKAYQSHVTIWKDVLVHQPKNAYALNALGEREHEAKNDSEALRLMKRSLELNPRGEFNNFSLGCLLSDLGETDAAMDQFRKTIEIAPDSDLAHWNLGLLLFQSGKIAEGVEEFNRSIELVPNDSERHYQLGVRLMDARLTTEALAQFNRAIELMPDHPRAHLSLAMLLERGGKLDEAVPHFQKAVDSNPEDGMSHYLYGNALVAQGRGEDALAQFNEAARIAFQEVDVWISLAECYGHLGRWPEATTAAERALKLAKSGDDRGVITRCDRILSDCRAHLSGASETAPRPEIEPAQTP